MYSPSYPFPPAPSPPPKTATPCERFATRKGQPPCKENLMKWCQTDLAATAYRWRRFVGRQGPDDMLFGGLDNVISHDGIMAEEVTKRGWKVRGHG